MSWETVKLKEVCHIEKGSTGIMKAIPGDYPMVTMAEERKTHNEYQFDAKAIIIPMVSGSGHGKASINRIHYQEGKFAVGTILCAVIPKDHDVLEPLFLYHYCDVFKEELFVPLMRGMANVTLPMKALEELEIPLPSIDFQRKWLARFEHISGKQIALGEELTHQRALLTRLRQSILQDAVQGRLTAQWRQAHPNQEPASELLRRIRAEKAAAGKKEKTLPPVTAEEMPFELPEGWVWCRLGEVALFSEAGKSLKCDDRPIEAGEWGIIKMSAVSSKVFVEAHNKFLSKKAPNDLSNKIECGDLIFTRASGSKELTGVSSMVKILSSNLLLNDKTIRFKFIDNETAEFVQLFNNSFFARQYYEKIMSAKSTSMNNLTRPQFNGLPVPLPPLSEQTAIVARVEAMLERVSDMEAESARQRVWAEGLLQAALREAMGG